MVKAPAPVRTSTLGQSSALTFEAPATVCAAALGDPENRVVKRLVEPVSGAAGGVDADEQPDKMTAAASRAALLPPCRRGSVLAHRIISLGASVNIRDLGHSPLYQRNRGGPKAFMALPQGDGSCLSRA
jgi:hypothetical protein